MITKTCPTCKLPKKLVEFGNNKTKKDGLQRECKECTHQHSSNHYRKYHPIKYIKPNHKICSKCKIELPFENFNKLKLGKFNIDTLCKKCRSEEFQKWNNKGGKEWNNQYIKKRKENDYQFKLKHTLRLRLLDALKRKNVTKKHSAIKLLGCSIEECKQHLEKQFKPEMNWDNHGKVWEIDHIKPCSKFDLSDSEQQKECFHYTNLQPLTILENRQKSNKY